MSREDTGLLTACRFCLSSRTFIGDPISYDPELSPQELANKVRVDYLFFCVKMPSYPNVKHQIVT